MIFFENSRLSAPREETPLSYHSESVTRKVVRRIIVEAKRAPNPNLSETGERRKRREIAAKETSEKWEKLSRSSATVEDRAEYFEIATGVFLKVAVVLLLLGVVTVALSEMLDFVLGGYIALFLVPSVMIGSLIPPFVSKTSSSAKGKIVTFSTIELVICIVSTVAVIFGAVVFFNEFLPESYYIR